jgi:ribose transport system ATP-binding protein
MTLELSDVSKTFGGQPALRQVSLSIAYGQVHALVGENGSGKSTLIKILSGYHKPDPGSRAMLSGEPFELGNSSAAWSMGLRFVHQDLGLVPSLSVLDNMILGQPVRTGVAGRILWREAAREATRHLQLLGVNTDLKVRISELSLAERSAVAIARALWSAVDSRDRLILVLDEPTATLPADEVVRLLQIIEKLRNQGHAVLMVSHHLNEVLQVADYVTVLRDGVVAASVSRTEVNYNQLTELIVGHAISVGDEAAVPSCSEAGRPRQSVLSVRALSGSRVTNVDFDIRAGEIVGVAGITGSGRESLGSLLTGRLPRGGIVSLLGATVRPDSPSAALAHGLVGVPGDRSAYGIFPNLSVRDNMAISYLAPHAKWGRIMSRAEKREVAGWISDLAIATSSGEAPILSLSGGNQQKVLIGRALRMHPKALVLDDPSVGIDIGARAQIHKIIAKSVASGLAVLLISTDSDELASLSDRVLVFGQGRVAAELSKGPGLTAEEIDAQQLSAARDSVETEA